MTLDCSFGWLEKSIEKRKEYVLETPWFLSSQLSQREWLLLATPEPFRRRNVFVSGSVLDSKYDLQYTFNAKPKWSIWSDQELQKLADANAASSN